jgi:hypothetical protein
VLTVLSFAVAIVLQLPMEWIVMVCLLTSFLYLSFRYPDGRKSWKYSPRETVYTIITIISLCAMGALVNKAVENTAFPDAVTIILWTGTIVLAILLLASVIAPSGMIGTNRFEDTGPHD